MPQDRRNLKSYKDMNDGKMYHPIKFYKVYICDYQGNKVLALDEYYHNSRKAAAIAIKFIEDCPPAQDFKIERVEFHKMEIAYILSHNHILKKSG